ncbi:hypothetical protein PIB30_092917 [Stylosanthes scabra]|uniref:Cation/H(+) antiporter 28 n=1 Tax=Stylosanthes scabra TaxID=79078 RepID=A0ABU6ZTL7_9FABA|nr:hypothetical protein [Stylosanthes scabra]
MDPLILFKRPPRHAQVAYGGILSTFIIGLLITPIIGYFPHQSRLLQFTIYLCTLLSSSASPVLTRLITHLKIGKSDIGKLVIGAGMHSDFVCSLVLCLGYIISPIPLYSEALRNENALENHKKILKTQVIMGLVVLVQMVVVSLLSPLFMNWVNNENPEGKPMKGSHLVLSLAFMVLMCATSPLYGYHPILSAFVTGICLPREGRLSKWVITRINYLLTIIFYPIFFLWMGYEADFRKSEPLKLGTWLKFLILLIVGMTGKVVGTIISGAMLGFRWPDSVVIGLLLTIKGHPHIYLAIRGKTCDVTISTCIGMIIASFVTVVQAPSVVANIIKRARKRARTHKMALQLLDQTSELRILLFVHGPHNVPASINFMEISRGTANPGIIIYIADKIELTDEISATLERDEGVHMASIKDKKVMDMRDQVTNCFQSYVTIDGDGITLVRTMVLSTINNMPQDICVLAEDLMIAFIILPFHRTQRSDGTLDGGNQGFRYVNRKVLRSAPCSVGILVDRGLGNVERISRSEAIINVAVIFIGGKDDREALAYASRVSQHPGVKLTVIRLLVDINVEPSRLAGYMVVNPEQEMERQQDDEYFAQFYENHVVGGRILYIEKHLTNAAETFSTLRSLKGLYSLVIVGREGGVNSILTRGMNDWQQCPELGPIGDVLSGPDFSTNMSVLIIQQHRLKGELDGLDEDFSIM